MQDKWDKIELFFNTRKGASESSLTKFCHHFVFSPDGEGVEITRLRNEEERPLCNPDDLCLEEIETPRRSQVYITIKEEALFGFDPKRFPNLGFAYKICCGITQSFPYSSLDVNMEKRPNMWSTLHLKER